MEFMLFSNQRLVFTIEAETTEMIDSLQAKDLVNAINGTLNNATIMEKPNKGDEKLKPCCDAAYMDDIDGEVNTTGCKHALAKKDGSEESFDLLCYLIFFLESMIFTGLFLAMVTMQCIPMIFKILAGFKDIVKCGSACCLPPKRRKVSTMELSASALQKKKGQKEGAGNYTPDNLDALMDILEE
ncbi:hypothetical protein ARMGADRAFT_1033529 [Armillaria gallica]|uniref:Uncharacterized protein n=1 Tax=Armillaria gallica TaxID=47427 RepID=A0A2H3DN94_ARMGA|nr:hypothetical protein ARMGADRAFT_1033529 [Armillaria gallica]